MPEASQNPFIEYLEPLAAYLAGDPAQSDVIKTLFARSDAGEFDDMLAAEAQPDEVLLTTSSHLLTMSLRHSSTGMLAKEFYKGDPQRYVRNNLLVQRILGIRRLTLGWPVYAFGAEITGQLMMYPENQAPGSDPGEPLLDITRPGEIPDYDPDSEIARIVRENLLQMGALGKCEVVAHLPAPYSLAAEIVGQENLLIALTQDPDAAITFVNALNSKILEPWCADLYAAVLNVWLELSDASGSPMFVGPSNFLSAAAAPVQALRAVQPWGDRVFVANYRGDTHIARRQSTSRRKRAAVEGETISFEEMTDAKLACCPWFLTRLEADQVDLETYKSYCIAHKARLYAGIGATRVDRNSIIDRDSHVAALMVDVEQRAQTVKDVAEAVAFDGKTAVPAWPGDLYLEDTNDQSDVRLIRDIAMKLEGHTSC